VLEGDSGGPKAKDLWSTLATVKHLEHGSRSVTADRRGNGVLTFSFSMLSFAEEYADCSKSSEGSVVCGVTAEEAEVWQWLARTT